MSDRADRRRPSAAGDCDSSAVGAQQTRPVGLCSANLWDVLGVDIMTSIARTHLGARDVVCLALTNRSHACHILDATAARDYFGPISQEKNEKGADERTPQPNALPSLGSRWQLALVVDAHAARLHTVALLLRAMRRVAQAGTRATGQAMPCSHMARVHTLAARVEHDLDDMDAFAKRWSVRKSGRSPQTITWSPSDALREAARARALGTALAIVRAASIIDAEIELARTMRSRRHSGGSNNSSGGGGAIIVSERCAAAIERFAGQDCRAVWDQAMPCPRDLHCTGGNCYVTAPFGCLGVGDELQMHPTVGVIVPRRSRLFEALPHPARLADAEVVQMDGVEPDIASDADSVTGLDRYMAIPPQAAPDMFTGVPPAFTLARPPVLIPVDHAHHTVSGFTDGDEGNTDVANSVVHGADFDGDEHTNDPFGAMRVFSPFVLDGGDKWTIAADPSINARDDHRNDYDDGNGHYDAACLHVELYATSGSWDGRPACAIANCIPSGSRETNDRRGHRNISVHHASHASTRSWVASPMAMSPPLPLPTPLTNGNLVADLVGALCDSPAVSPVAFEAVARMWSDIPDLLGTIGLVSAPDAYSEASGDAADTPACILHLHAQPRGTGRVRAMRCYLVDAARFVRKALSGSLSSGDARFLIDVVLQNVVLGAGFAQDLYAPLACATARVCATVCVLGAPASGTIDHFDFSHFDFSHFDDVLQLNHDMRRANVPPAPINIAVGSMELDGRTAAFLGSVLADTDGLERARLAEHLGDPHMERNYWHTLLPECVGQPFLDKAHSAGAALAHRRALGGALLFYAHCAQVLAVFGPERVMMSHARWATADIGVLCRLLALLHERASGRKVATSKLFTGNLIGLVGGQLSWDAAAETETMLNEGRRRAAIARDCFPAAAWTDIVSAQHLLAAYVEIVQLLQSPFSTYDHNYEDDWRTSMPKRMRSQLVAIASLALLAPDDARMVLIARMASDHLDLVVTHGMSVPGLAHYAH